MLKNSNGYTLTEMMMVISLAVVAMAVVGPSLVQAHQRYSVKSIADEFVTAHSHAKLAAVEYGVTAELRIDGRLSDNGFWVHVDTGGLKPVRVHAKKWTHGTITTDRNRLCFDMRGLPSTSGQCQEPNATVTFTNGSHSETVRITGLGVVRR
jgi:prepilin-type N-terminal cleavage/methylation domain-containing protein